MSEELHDSLLEDLKQLQSDRDHYKSELEKLQEEHKWLLRNYEEEKMLVSDYTKLKSLAEKYREALESIAKNSCCKPCLEAGLWAQSALDEGRGND